MKQPIRAQIVVEDQLTDVFGKPYKGLGWYRKDGDYALVTKCNDMLWIEVWRNYDPREDMLREAILPLHEEGYDNARQKRYFAGVILDAIK